MNVLPIYMSTSYVWCLKEEGIGPIASGVMDGYKLLMWVLGMEHEFSEE